MYCMNVLYDNFVFLLVTIKDLIELDSLAIPYLKSLKYLNNAKDFNEIKMIPYCFVYSIIIL